MEIHKPLTAHIFERGKRVIFLTGSIEMGAAEDWQAKVTEALLSFDGYLLNPRRDDWDSSWVQDISDDQFRWQVDWELDSLHCADLVLMYFGPATKSPISLLELGLLADKHKTLVACPAGFWRRGNVQVLCNRYNIPLGDSLDWLINSAVSWLCSGRVEQEGNDEPADL